MIDADYVAIFYTILSYFWIVDDGLYYVRQLTVDDEGQITEGGFSED